MGCPKFAPALWIPVSYICKKTLASITPRLICSRGLIWQACTCHQAVVKYLTEIIEIVYPNIVSTSFFQESGRFYSFLPVPFRCFRASPWGTSHGSPRCSLWFARRRVAGGLDFGRCWVPRTSGERGRKAGGRPAAGAAALDAAVDGWGFVHTMIHEDPWIK